MAILENSPWYFELNDQDKKIFSTPREVAAAVRANSNMNAGRLHIYYDDGPRPRWQRLFGLAPRYICSFASLEWFDKFASLIFLDNNGSEFRALDKAQPVTPPKAARSQIAHGEVRPCPAEECMDMSRAFRALEEALENGARPEWLSYRFVK